MATRFSKSSVLKELDKRAERIAVEHKFDHCNGTSQIDPKGLMTEEQIDRAVAYGRMRAFEDFACAIEEGFRFTQDVE